MTMHISTLPPNDQAGFGQMLAIYQSSIEPSEQKPAEELAKCLRDPRYHFLVARNGDEVAGFSIQFFPSSGGFWLLEYLAVDQRTRSKGLGCRIFVHARDAAAARAPGAPCLLEVDQSVPPVALTHDKPSDDTVRRLAFYRLLHCRKLEGLDYILPLDVGGTPPPMLLLVHGLEWETSVPKATVRHWLTTLYVEVYECTPRDARIAIMLASASDIIPLSTI